MNMNLLDRADVRLAVLDLEASALDKGSYPIEIGCALIEGASRPLRVWSALIEPTEDWTRDGVWSPQSQQVHGISIEDLRRNGLPVGIICDRLNTLLRSAAAVVSDAPMYDQEWLNRLFEAAGQEQRFILYDFERLAGCLHRDDYRQHVHLLKRTPAPHRAAGDAVRLASAILEAKVGYPPRVELLET